MSDRKRSECLGDAEFVSLLYDELSDSERGPFDDHLEACSSCVDEFAALSEARLSAYEWNRDEFADLVTPVIDIPYSQAASVGWFRQALAGISTMSKLGAASAAVVVAALVGGFFLFSDSGGRVSEKRSEPATQSPAVIKSSEPTVAAVEKVPNVGKFVAAKSAVRKVPVATVKRSPEKPSPKSDLALAKTPRPQVRPESLVARQQTAPRLTSNAELSDDSLRLADLFSELDANE